MDNYTDVDKTNNWNELSVPIMKSDEYFNDNSDDSSQEKDITTQKNKLSTPVLTIQFILCLMFLTVLFLLKTFSPYLYSDIKNWYDTELTASMFYSGDFRNFDYTSMFDSTSDEI